MTRNYTYGIEYQTKNETRIMKVLAKGTMEWRELMRKTGNGPDWNRMFNAIITDMAEAGMVTKTWDERGETYLTKA